MASRASQNERSDAAHHSGSSDAVLRGPEFLRRQAALVGYRARTPENSASVDALAFVASRPELTIPEVAGVFLLDQEERLAAGTQLPAEIYCRVLRARDEVLSQEFEWELVSNEFCLKSREAGDSRMAAQLLQQFSLRFPAHRERLEELFSETRLDETCSLQMTHAVQRSGSVTKSLMSPDLKATEFNSGLDGDATHIEIEEMSDAGSVTLLVDPVEGESVSPLKACSPFATLPLILLRRLEDRMIEQSFEPGEFLIRQGDPGDGLFILTDGYVDILAAGVNGTKHRIAGSEPGDILGEMALLTEEPRTADVVAATKVTSKFLSGEAFNDLVTEFPVIAQLLTQLLAERLGNRGRDALAGKTLDNYCIERRLGRGGMAIVYRARHITTDQVVALKMMSHRLVFDANALQLFQRETRLIESFDHPNIVRMIGRFRAFRSFFIVMEYCDGVTLDLIVKRAGAMPESQFRHVMAQLASAVQCAHEMGVVHRDIKPSNVMLTSDGIVKLMDFGLANPVDRGLTSPSNRMTITGTPRYMAPEQMNGEPADPRADYFSLGCTAYKLLTGNDLIADRTIVAIQKRHQNWSIPTISGLPSDIAAFLEAALQVDPGQRKIDLREVASWS
jgi:CRP-like cAMP-binding protein